MDTILNLLPLDDRQRALFSAAAPNCEQLFRPSTGLRYSADGVSLRELARATVILGCAPPQSLQVAANLKWLQTWSAGVDPYLAPGVLPEGTVLTSAVGAYGAAVAEHMLASVLALFRRLPDYRDAQRAGRWAEALPVKTLRGATVLCLGTGDIGGHFAASCQALGAHTVGLSRHPERQVPGLSEHHALAELDSWLPRADVVAMALPAAPETIHLMDARRLALLRPSAVLVNAGRGSAVDCMALAEALKAGRLWAAALDVTEPEPLPSGHPLWSCPNLLLTPHTAGGDGLENTVQAVVDIALENLRRYVGGQPLLNRMR